MVKPSKKNVVQFVSRARGTVVITTDGVRHYADESANAESLKELWALRVRQVNEWVKGDAGALFVYEDEEIVEQPGTVKWGKKMVKPISEWVEWTEPVYVD